MVVLVSFSRKPCSSPRRYPWLSESESSVVNFSLQLTGRLTTSNTPPCSSMLSSKTHRVVAFPVFYQSKSLDKIKYINRFIFFRNKLVHSPPKWLVRTFNTTIICTQKIKWKTSDFNTKTLCDVFQNKTLPVRNMKDPGICYQNKNLA